MTAAAPLGVHRGVPLSKGSAVSGRAGAGRSPAAPPRVALRPRRSLRSGAVASPGRFDPEGSGCGEHPAGRPPAIPGFSERSWKQGSVPMATSYTSGIENNLDWCHPAFAHPWTHPQWYAARLGGPKDQAYELRVGPEGLVVFAPPTASGGDPVPARPAVALRFSLPNRATVEPWAPSHLVSVGHFAPTAEASCRSDWMRSKYLPALRPGGGPPGPTASRSCSSRTGCCWKEPSGATTGIDASSAASRLTPPPCWPGGSSPSPRKASGPSARRACRPAR